MISPKTLLLGLLVAALQPAVASSPARDSISFTAGAIDQTGDNAKPADVVPIPEPTSAVLGLIATAVILLRRRFA